MSRHMQWAMRWLLAGVVLVPSSAPAGAQTVLVQVLEAETSRPLTGAIGHLVSSSGDVLASRLTDRNGRVLFADLEAGRYRVRAEMLGHSTGESDVFSVVAGGSVPLVLRLPTRAIELEGVEVTAEAGPCEMRPGEEGRLLADVWEEARKALSAAAVAERQGLYRYSLLKYERALDENGVILDEDQTRQRGYMRTPFEAHAVEELTETGFVRRTATEWTYYAPDAPALLSDPFLDTHCFRLVAGGPERPDLIGLAFEPTGENEDLPDISGTVWLDRDSVSLRWLEYTYENLEPEVRPGDATGRVEFQRMPGGAWIVPEWWIRMPLVEVDLALDDRRARITGFRENGGRVLEIVEAGGQDLARGSSTGTIEGLVVDSLGLPVESVRVGSAGSNQRVFTNAEGRFSLVGLNEGTYRVRFIHPALDTLGLGPPEIAREVRSGVSSSIELVLPTPAHMLRELCGPEATEHTGVLGGVVRAAGTGEPVVAAEVRVRWSAITLNGADAGLIGREVYTELQTTTDRFGVYRLCAVPRREELSVVVSVEGLDGTEQRVAISEEEAARMIVTRYAPRGAARQEAENPRRDATFESPGAVREAVKHGRIQDAVTGAALDRALVALPSLGVSAVTDADGGVSFEGLAPGTYPLKVQRLGYRAIEGALEVPGGSEFVVMLDRMVAADGDDWGALVGRVTDEEGRPVSDVGITVVGQPSRRAITDARGRFRIADLEPGLVEVSFERLGHQSRTTTFVIQPGRTADLAVVLPTEAIDLEPIAVTVRPRFLEQSGFYSRRDQGFGRHIERDEIERLQPELASDVIRRHALGLDIRDPRLSSNGGSTVGSATVAINPRVQSLVASRTGSTACILPVYVDGVLMVSSDLNQVSPETIEAIEIYDGGMTPAQYQGNNPCGLILIWTRR